MKLKIYLDVHGYESEPSHFFPYTGSREKGKGDTRYCFDVELPDPMEPDVEINIGKLAEE